MKIIAKFHYNPATYWVPEAIFAHIFEALKQTYPDIEFELHDTVQMDGSLFPNIGVMGLVNPENNKKIVVSYLDRNRYALISNKRHAWEPETIQQYLTTPDILGMQNACWAYHNIDNQVDIRYFSDLGPQDIHYFKNFQDVLVPFSYTPYTVKFDKILMPQLYTQTKARDRKQAALFRGWMWEPRKQIFENNSHNEILGIGEKLNEEEYVQEMLEYRCGLSLNGAAEICNRDLENMAMGIPVLRPVLKHADCHNTLIPDIHYIAFDYDREEYRDSAYLGAPKAHNTKLIWDAMIDRWEQVKNDYDFLDYVAQNGREWYLQNGSIDANVDLFMKLANLNLLK